MIGLPHQMDIRASSRTKAISDWIRKNDVQTPLMKNVKEKFGIVHSCQYAL